MHGHGENHRGREARETIHEARDQVLKHNHAHEPFRPTPNLLLGAWHEEHQDVRTNLQDVEGLAICPKSLVKLGELEDEELANYIVYVDEVSSFWEFTHSDTLDSILQQVFVLLARVARCAGKLIVSDALINDNTFEFVKYRDNANQWVPKVSRCSRGSGS